MKVNTAIDEKGELSIFIAYEPIFQKNTDL